MSADAVAKTTPSNAPAPRRRMWIFALIVVLAVIFFGYLSLANMRDGVVNNDFYRVLYEATNKFNENLDQLNKMHVNGESINSIRAQLPSYQRKQTNQGQDTNKNFKYILVGDKIKIENGNFEAEVQMADILPSLKKGFSQYLFANSEGEVLATISDEKTISINNLASINKEIERSKRRFQLSVKESESSEGENGTQRLPSYSSHVDIGLSHEEFRIFIFPFSPVTELSTKHKNLKQGNSDDVSTDETINTLYLVGLLPKHKLQTRGTGYWNLSLLLVTLVSLLFIWTLLRLYLLPKNQPITPLYRSFTMFSSYSFFIVLIALVLAFMQKTTLQASKDKAATTYAKKLSTLLNEDLFKVFNGLASYRPFYQYLFVELDKFSLINKSNGTGSSSNSSATDNFSRMVEKSLASITTLPCEFQPDFGVLPGYAFTHSKVYSITFNCSDATQADIKRKRDRFEERVLLQAHQEKVNDEFVFDFMAGNLDLKVGPKDKVESHINGKDNLPAHTNIFTVLAINEEGNTTLPSIYYQESNAPPKIYNLTHRDYYKKVKDYQGWQLCLTAEEKNNHQCEFNNVYIQRLLNVGDGTRGTTISMPMYNPKDTVTAAGGLAYILAADVILPSLSLAAPAPYDFTYMVIDRNSGDVLFHSDESRTLIENLFYSGNTKSNLNQWIKAGLDPYPGLSEKIIDGHYHGQPGRFVLIPAPVDAWAIVIFYPDDSLGALMSNQFFFISVSFAVALLVLVFLLFICRCFFYTNTLKTKLHIPEKINGRVIIIIASIILSVIYSLYYIGLLFDLAKVWSQPVSLFSLVLPSAGVLIIFLCLYRIYNKHFAVASSNKHIKGLIPLFAVAIMLSIAQLSYLHFVASPQMPLKALGFHYQQTYCNWLNYERQESVKMALSRYPNSITQQRIAPLTLLPLTPNLAKSLNDKNACEKHSSQVDPDDYINPSSLMGVTYLWQWIKTYLLPNTELSSTAALPTIQKDLKVALWPVVGYGLLILFIIWLWLKFNRRMLWTRLYCSGRFLQHIEGLTKSKSTLEQDQHCTKLIIECDRVKLNGIGLALLLRSAVMHESKSASAGLNLNNLLAGFDTLYQLSPYLQKLGANNNFLPNLKLNVEESSDSKKLDVQIWDIETCLAQTDFRQHLLDLIMEIKSLTLANQLNSFTIFTGYHSLQRVKMKDPLSIEKGSILEHTEYLSWAECLMDFNVKVAEVFERGVDKQLLEQEIADFPELFFLSPGTLDISEAAEEKLWNKRESPNNGSHWATINYILLRAEALYRFKWESCSNAEKLALLNLDKQHSLNPANTQMIEHLAVNGLVKVKQGHLEIVNRSFAHFIRNAETTDTVNRLVSQSEAGVWKDYQLPLGLLMFLIIVGIALTSGESIYIIAASVAGVLTTIASIATSASMLRGQFKE